MLKLDHKAPKEKIMDYQKEKFDIIIQAGQSNAQGCGRGEVTKEYVPDADA